MKTGKDTTVLRASLACGLALALGLSGAASSQERPPGAPIPPLGSTEIYMRGGPSLIFFNGGGVERALNFGLGAKVNLDQGGYLPEGAFGIEAEYSAFTGPGAGWGISRLRGLYEFDAGNGLSFTILGGVGSIHDNFGGRGTGASLGLRVDFYIDLFEPSPQDGFGDQLGIGIDYDIGDGPITGFEVGNPSPRDGIDDQLGIGVDYDIGDGPTPRINVRNSPTWKVGLQIDRDFFDGAFVPTTGVEAMIIGSF